MKSLIAAASVAVLLTLTLAAPSQAACGIGTTLWEGDERLSARILASLTNYWTLKGISTTFELGDCTEKDNLFKRVSNAKVRHYANTNLDRLVSDMARGSGEHLDALGELLELPAADRAILAALAQQHFEALVPRDDINADELVGALIRLMAEDETLARTLNG